MARARGFTSVVHTCVYSYIYIYIYTYTVYSYMYILACILYIYQYIYIYREREREIERERDNIGPYGGHRRTARVGLRLSPFAGRCGFERTRRRVGRPWEEREGSETRGWLLTEEHIVRDVILLFKLMPDVSRFCPRSCCQVEKCLDVAVASALALRMSHPT